MIFYARLLQRLPDRLARCATATADEPLARRPAENTQPPTQLVPSLEPHIDVPLARIALEQVEDE